jgi:ketosteroid isomerase-like protein
MSEDDPIFFANEAFYLAFAARDMTAMEDIWARDTPPTCVHPGWQPLIGRRQVIESWRNIMENGEAPEISFSGARVFRLGDAAYVTCTEHLARSTLIATNIFIIENGQWKIIHHQAGAMLAPRPTAPTTLQ